jgi:predicted unusual protein kinase regulating ubiquinone biosynthesis (AarF/ABC1/UbiB family)
MFDKIQEWYTSFVEILCNCLFCIKICGIIIDEMCFYFVFKNYDRMIHNLTNRLAYQNILYVKIFQAFALNHNIIDDSMNNSLLKFTDNVPWTNKDIDKGTLITLEKKYNIKIFNDYTPINSGMISLVFKGQLNGETIVIKIKRKGIETTLNDGIQKMLFCVRLLTIIPFVKNYQLSDIIHNNINLIRFQTDFQKEVENIETMQKNCKNMKYIKIPKVHKSITDDLSNLIVMEFIKGNTLQELDPSDYYEYSKQLLKFGLVTLLIHGKSHGDLHTGNLLFIKDENDAKYKYKIGILDFGIVYEIGKTKEALFYVFENMLRIPSEDIARIMSVSGLIEPVECIKNLPELHYENIVKILTKLVDDTIVVSKHLSQINVFKSLYNLNEYVVNNDLIVNGFKIRPSDDLIKFQVMFSMLYGVLFKLCGSSYIEVTNKVMIELFHIDESES